MVLLSWTYSRMVPPHRALIGLWRTCPGRRRPERAARQGFWGTNKLFCKVILLRFDLTFANVVHLTSSSYTLDAGFRALAHRPRGGFECRIQIIV